MAVVLQGSIILHDLLEPISLDGSGGEAAGAEQEPGREALGQGEDEKLDGEDTEGGKAEPKEEEGEPVSPEELPQKAGNGPADRLGTLPEDNSYDAWVAEHTTPRSSSHTNQTPPALIPTAAGEALGPDEGLMAEEGADADLGEGRSKPYNSQHRSSYDTWLDENQTGQKDCLFSCPCQVTTGESEPEHARHILRLHRLPFQSCIASVFFLDLIVLL